MIRKFKAEDIDQVMQIWLGGNIEAHSFIEEEYWISNFFDVREKLLKAEIYVYKQDEQIVGFVGMQGNYLAGIFVDKMARSNGIGTKLLDYVKEFYSNFSLNVYKMNKRAVNFYLREGLKMIAEEFDEETNNAEYLMAWNIDEY